MSWSVKRRKSKYCVINNDTGRAVKCYSTITSAEAHKRMLMTTITGARSKVSALKKKIGPKNPRRRKR